MKETLHKIGRYAANHIVVTAILLLCAGMWISKFTRDWMEAPPKLAPNEPTRLEQRFGWIPEVADEHTANALKEKAGSIKFKGRLGDSRGKVALLWTASTAILGQHIPTLRQEIGDCVSMGGANVADYLQCVELVAGDFSEFHHASTMYIYAVSRQLIGKGRIPDRSDGSVGVWAAEGMTTYGIVAADNPLMPPYSGAEAKRWGARGYPKQWAIEEGKLNLIKTYSAVNKYADVRDAIVNGYPITIASGVGFEGGKITKAGKLFLKRGGSWQHQMSIIGVDDTVAGGAAYVLNSWGEAGAPKPLNDEPPGGFWITGTDVDAILREKDSWAFSTFDGFPARELDLSIVGVFKALERKVVDNGKTLKIYATDGSVRRIDNAALTANKSKSYAFAANETNWIGALYTNFTGAIDRLQRHVINRRFEKNRLHYAFQSTDDTKSNRGTSIGRWDESTGRFVFDNASRSISIGCIKGSYFTLRDFGYSPAAAKDAGASNAGNKKDRLD